MGDNTEILVADVERLRKELNVEKDLMAQDNQLGDIAQSEIYRLRTEIEDEMQRLTPMFDSAIATLNAVSPRELQDLRNMANPPEVVLNVGLALCWLFGFNVGSAATALSEAGVDPNNNNKSGD